MTKQPFFWPEGITLLKSNFHVSERYVTKKEGNSTYIFTSLINLGGTLVEVAQKSGLKFNATA